MYCDRMHLEHCACDLECNNRLASALIADSPTAIALPTCKQRMQIHARNQLKRLPRNQVMTSNLLSGLYRSIHLMLQCVNACAIYKACASEAITVAAR